MHLAHRLRPTAPAFAAVWLALCGSASGFGLCGGDDAVPDLRQVNRKLNGRVDDYTANHGRDNRVWSKALGSKRDVYVYVPPGYDPEKRYPLVYWLHGLTQDEKSFLDVIPQFDRLIANGTLPKFVMVAPDGSPRGRAGMHEDGTFYLNSPLGNFEDYIVFDVWNLVVSAYAIRPEREAHMLAGASMGGFGAYNLGIKHRKDFGAAIGVMPALNLRYSDCRGSTRTDFDPNCFGFNEQYRPNEPVASFFLGLVTFRQRRLIAPVFGEGPDVIAKVSAQNPAEMLTAYDVKPGDLEMFAGYGDRDEFNFDAQVQSFAYLAKQRKIDVSTVLVLGGKHNKETGMKMVPALADWIRPRLEKYAPK